MKLNLLKRYIKKVILENFDYEDEDFTDFTDNENLANLLKLYDKKHKGRFFIKNSVKGLPSNLDNGMSLYDILDYFYDATESRDPEVWYQNSLGFRNLGESLLLREIFGFLKRKKKDLSKVQEKDFEPDPKYLRLTDGDRKLAFALEFFDRYFSSKSKKLINFIKNKIKR